MDNEYINKQLHTFADSFINNLTPKAIDEISGGYLKDIDKLMSFVIKMGGNIIGAKQLNKLSIPDIENVDFLQNVYSSFDETLKIQSLNYFIFTMLPNFDMGWRHLEWSNITQRYRKIVLLSARDHGKSFYTCYAFPIWRLWRYRNLSGIRNTKDNRNSRETVIITNESKLGRIHLDKISDEIKGNDLLHEILLPRDVRQLGSDKIKTKNRAEIHLRSKGGQVRGLHVGAVVLDDFLDRSVLYSADQRAKFSEIWKGDIQKILNTGGYMIVSGTPFREDDLYAEIAKDDRFKVFHYPAIYPDGRLLAPERYTFKQLMHDRSTLGSILFSREMLCRPVSNNSTLFPYEWLHRSIIGMENIGMTENIQSYPIKMKRVVVGCDFSVSGNIGSDFTVFAVWGLGYDDKLYLIYYYRARGISHNEQISRIVMMNDAYKPNEIVAEANNFQKNIIEDVRQRGVNNITEFTTTAYNKKSMYDGLPSLSALFERNDIKIPYKTGETKEKADNLFTEFNSISFDDDTGRLESVSGKDDICMACFFAIQDLRGGKQNLKISYI